MLVLRFVASDGFIVGDNLTGTGATNLNTNTYVAWNWKAGGTAVSNTDGSLTSQVSANVDAGFSIVAWTAPNDSGTVGHGLDSTPELIIAKPLGSGTNWYVQAPVVTAVNQVLNLDSTTAKFNPGVNHFNDTYPTSTVFSYGGYLGDDLTNDDKIAFCFHSVDGYSKVGSYTGNGSADGPFVYTGFRPAWVLIKSHTAGYDWVLDDSARSPFNEGNATLFPNASSAEYTGGAYGIDFLSNGFKLRTTYGQYNQSGGGYLYLAFAENPFKYANAR